MTTKGRKNHYWQPTGRPSPDRLTSECRNCGLLQDDLWLLDEQGRAVFGKAWIKPNGEAVVIRPFAYNNSRKPQEQPTQSWAQHFPHAPVSRSPECPKSPEGWTQFAPCEQ